MAATHAAMLAVWDKEADRFWVRSNLMMLANGALLSAVVAVNQTLPVRLLVCTFGLLFSIAWLLLNNKGGYYVSRWRPVIEDFEREMQKRRSFPVCPLLAVRPDPEAIAPVPVLHWLRVLSGTATPRLDAGDIMHLIILGFVLTWLSLATVFAFGAFHARGQNKSAVSVQPDIIKQLPNDTKQVQPEVDGRGPPRSTPYSSRRRAAKN